MRLFPIATACLIALAGAAHADKIGYQCAMEGTQKRGWIQSLIFIAHDLDNDRVVISDAVTLGSNNGQPVEGRLLVNNDRRMTVRWSVDVMARGNQKATMNYRATYVKNSGRVTVLAQPVGFANSFNLGGSCVAKKLS